MYLGVDIGGTKTLIALFSRRGRVLRRRKFKTAQGYKTFIHDLENHLNDFKKFKIRSVVVAIPGIVQKNYSMEFGNRNWRNIDLVTPLKSLFGCPIYFENDASLGALYESYRLHGRTVFLTFSTGIGGGVVEKNRILPESSEFEPGHKKYWYDGKLKEWEDIAAASAIESFYHVDYATRLRKKEVMQDIAKRVYLGLPDVIDEYRPDTIVLGGPLGKIFKLYVKYLPENLEVKLRRPKRPNESAIYGCYLLAKQKERG
ncbi:MAG: ROK family protein [Candidatus Saccharibacteria bacterium]|nr:ROK family protein [Candidatus Saccharibacteria bacterium]